MGASTGIARITLSVNQLSAGLFKWYRGQEKLRISWPRVQTLLPTMLGTLESPTFHLHGGETNGMLRYALVLLERFAGKLGSEVHVFRRCISSLAKMMELIKKHPVKFPSLAIEEQITYIIRSSTLARDIM